MSREVILLWMLRGGLATSTQSHTRNDSYECARKQNRVPGTGPAVCIVKVYLRSDMGMQLVSLYVCSCSHALHQSSANTGTVVLVVVS
jgi:hypothetical protein